MRVLRTPPCATDPHSQPDLLTPGTVGKPLARPFDGVFGSVGRLAVPRWRSLASTDGWRAVRFTARRITMVRHDYDGAASVSFVRCTTLPWFSHSAGDILRLLQHARFIIDSGRAQPTLVRKATSDRSRATFALRILRFPGLPVARTLESSRDQAFMRRGATLCSLSMVECVGVVVCNRWFRYQYVIGRINNTLLSHFTAPDQTPFRWEVFAQGD